MKRTTTIPGVLAALAASVVTVGSCANRQSVDAVTDAVSSQGLVTRGAEIYGYSCGRCHNARSAVERTDRSWETIVDHMRVRANLTGQEARAVTAFMRALNVAPVEHVVYDTLVIVDTVIRIDSVFVVTERPAQIAPPVTDTVRVRPPERAVQPPPRPRPPPGVDPAELIRRGRDLVSSKGCIGCHVVAGAGGSVGPDLDALFTRRDSLYVRRKLRDPRFDNSSTVMPAFGLSDAEVAAITAYLRSLAGGGGSLAGAGRPGGGEKADPGLDELR